MVRGFQRVVKQRGQVVLMPNQMWHGVVETVRSAFGVNLSDLDGKQRRPAVAERRV